MPPSRTTLRRRSTALSHRAAHVHVVEVGEEAKTSSPLDALEAFSRPGNHAFLRFATGAGFRGAPWSFLGISPSEVVACRSIGSSKTLNRALEGLRPHELKGKTLGVPFPCGWAGLLGYEARSGLERTPSPRRSPLGFPALWFGRYEQVVAWNHRDGTVFACALGRTSSQATTRATRLAERVRRIRKQTRSSQDLPALATTPAAQHDAKAFQSSVRATRLAILRGDLFQANVSQRFDARIHVHPVALFRQLALSQPAPYMTYLDLGEGRCVLSASPERFLRVHGRVVETDPMKGTRPRGHNAKTDRALRHELEISDKDRAELAMIVDLSRNDLARTCEPGSVRVMTDRKLVRFARVHQAIAVVRGKLQPGLDRVDALKAAFPPGSVTGAPKVRAMEIIDELEGEGRGPYCGALGWMAPDGDMDLAVAIRTIVVSKNRATYRVGGGITLGSDPKEEWRETLDKGRGLFAALAGKEDLT